MEMGLRALPPAQRTVLISLAYLAQYGAPAVVDVDGVTVTLDVGEALVSGRGLAATLRLGEGSRGESLVRRALASGRRIGLIATRPARPKGDAPPDARGDAPRSAPRDAPPIIVRYLRHRDVLWPAPTSDAPRDAPGGAPPDARGDAIPVVQQIASAHQAGRPRERARLGPLGAELMTAVAKGMASALEPLAAQEDADDLERLVPENFAGVDDALAYVAQTCRERSRPGNPYVIRTQRLVLAMLRDVRPGTAAGVTG
jgi:hypothetical protein